MKASGFAKRLIELLIIGVFAGALLPVVLETFANIQLEDPLQATLISVVGIVIVVGVVYSIYKTAVGNL